MGFLIDLHEQGRTAKGYALDSRTSLRGTAARRSPSGLVYAFTGFAVVAGRVMAPDSEVPESLLRRALADPRSVSLDMRGAVALAVHDPSTGRSVLVNDPFGSCYLVKYQDQRRTVIATDLKLLRDHLQEHGTTLRKSVRHLATMFTTGFGGLGSAPYEDVTILDFGTWVEVKDGLAEVKELDLAPLVQEAKELDYESGLERTHAEFQETFHTLTQWDGLTSVSHLTGGADSRLMLSYLLSEGSERDYLFFCYGHPGETDRITFEALARHFDLTSATDGGVSTAGPPESFEAELVAPLDYSSGLNTAGPTSDWLPADNLILAGGYGGMLRTTWGAPADAVGASSPRERLFFPWKGTLRPSGGSDQTYIAENFVEDLAAAADRVYQRGIDAGLAPDGAMDLMYVTRARIFMGNNTYLHNDFVRRYDPLYSLRGTLFAATRPWELRKANVIGFDLIQRNVPDLLRLPFDFPRFGSEYQAFRPVPEPLPFAHGDRELRTSSTIGTPRRRRSVSYRPKPTAEQIEFAKKKRASLRQVVWAEPVRERLRLLVDQIGDSELGYAFNVDPLRETLAKPFPNRVVIRNMINIYALMQWHGR